MDDQANQENSDLITQSESNITNEDSLKCNSVKLNNDDNEVSSESILSSINEECNRISSEHESNAKGDSEQLETSSNQMELENSQPERSDAESLKDNEGDTNADSDDHMEIETSIHFNEVNIHEASNSKENSDHVKESTTESEIKPDKIQESNKEINTDNDPNKITNTVGETNSDVGNNDFLIDSNEGSKSEESSQENKKLNENGVSDSENKGENKGKLKIKLRSFASLCKDDQTNDNSGSENSNQPGVVSNFEVTGVAVGDIVQHNNFVESDESGVMHLKISNVVGGEDSITGLSIDESGDALANIQISSITSLIEPISPEGSAKTTTEAIPEESNCQESSDQEKSNEIVLETENDKEVNETTEGSMETIVNIFKCSLIVPHSCYYCKKRLVCDFRMVFKKKSENVIAFLCSAKCKSKAISCFDDNHIVQKPRLFFERVCGNCGKDISNEPKSKIFSWQTREFCDKLCLADHIGEVARVCFFCKANVRVLYMVKYCVRFGSDVHQFCCNTCLETYKTTIKVCSFCQKNLTLVSKVVSPSNKEYCSSKCLKRAQRRDIGQVNYKEENNCTVCMKSVVNEYEFFYNNTVTFLCSTPCLNVFKYVNKVKSVNCCLCSRLLNAEDTSNYFFNGKKLRVFCSESCFSVFVISARKIVTCHYCKVKKYNFDMICSESDESGEYFSCSVCCLNLAETQLSKTTLNRDSSSLPEANSTSLPNNTEDANSNTAESATEDSAQTPSTPLLKNCNMCTKFEPAQFHMVMSDSTLRSFCSYVCATRFKCTFGFQVSGNIQEVKKQDGENQNSSILSKVLTSTDSQTSISTAISTSKTSNKYDIKDVKTLMKLFCPPHLSNKSTMCRPFQNTKGIQCKPHQWHKTSQTDEDSSSSINSTSEGSKAIIPVPIPVYVPTPMMMYSSPTPVPLVVPIPVPIPIFIPTLEKTTEELEAKIKSLQKSSSERNEKVEVAETSEELSETPEKQLEEEKKMLEEKEETETETILNLQYILPKFNIGPSQKEVSNPDNLKRKLESDSFSSSPKRRKVDDDEADDENEEEEVLNVMLGLSVWQSWTRKKGLEDPEGNAHLKPDLCSMESDTLGQSLIQFLSDLSSQSCQFDADTLFFILLGLQKYLFEKGSSHCIFLELNFDSFTSVFDEMVEKFFLRVSKPNTKCLQGTRVTEEMMWEARQLGAHTPHVLINTLFYFNTKIFRLKDASEHFKLSFDEISRETVPTSVSPDGTPVLTSYLKYSKEKGDKSDGPDDLLMYENKENPLRCPVKLYEFYLSKCPENIQEGEDKYYVYPEETCMPDSPVWYTSVAIEECTISKMLNRILLVKEVQENLFGQ
ncbi:UNVERIFIED_CONTAM: hypothetical protein RMT77_005435 [Armadillidium vulgare]